MPHHPPHRPDPGSTTPTGHHPRHLHRDDPEPDGMNADTTGETITPVQHPTHDNEEEQ